MRKDAKTNNHQVIAHVQSYHEGGGYESYAFTGFESNKFFTSDRYVELDDHFRRADGKPLEGYGLEIEVECAGINKPAIFADVLKKIIFVMFPADLFKMQSDSSLGGSWPHNQRAIGVECITQVMKKSCIRNHYRDFKAMYDIYFPALNASCSVSGRCGMHVNISNACFGKTEEKQKEAIRKLYYFVNKNFAMACTLFKRDISHTCYCSQMAHGITIEQAKERYIGGSNDHGACFNFSHFHVGRIELRLVGGQSDYWAFRNTMETVFFLVERMKRIAWKDLDNMEKVFSGCNQYVYKRLKDCNLSENTMATIFSNIEYEDLELHG